MFFFLFVHSLKLLIFLVKNSAKPYVIQKVLISILITGKGTKKTTMVYTIKRGHVVCFTEKGKIDVLFLLTRLLSDILFDDILC